MAARVDERLAQTFVELADAMVGGFDLIEFLHMLTERCLELSGSRARIQPGGNGATRG